MPRPPSLEIALTSPTPAALWTLRADLLEGGASPDDQALEIVGEFHAFLDRFATSTSSRDLNHLASKLDIGAIGGVVLEQLFESPNAKDLAMRVLTGGISEGLMVLASRQYVRAQEGELAALFREVAWTLYQRLWHWTSAANPDLPPTERRQLLDRITGPLSDSETPAAIVWPVLADPDECFDEDGERFVDVVAKLDFRGGKPLLVLPVIGNLRVQLAPVSLAEGSDCDQAERGQIDVRIVAPVVDEVLQQRNQHQARRGVIEGDTDERRDRIRADTNPFVLVVELDGPVQAHCGLESPVLVELRLRGEVDRLEDQLFEVVLV